MPEHNSNQSNKGPEYQYDITTGQLLIGRLAVNRHIEAGGSPASLYHLSELLIGDIDLPRYGARSINADLPRDEAVDYTRWLIDVVTQSGEHTRKDINERIIRRAYWLGLGPSTQELGRRTFSSLTELYSETGNKNVHFMGLFDDWPKERFTHYIRSVGDQLGHRPRVKDFEKMAEDDPLNHPSHFRIIKEFGGLFEAYRATGFEVFEEYSPEERLRHGVKVRRANGGLQITQRMMDYLSGSELGPSATANADAFGGIRSFQAEVAKEYGKDVYRRQQRHLEILGEIKEFSDRGAIPGNLFSGVASGIDLLERYAKYRVIDSLLSDLRGLKVWLSTEKLTDAELLSEMQKYDISITHESISHKSLELGFFDDVWPLDDYMSALVVPPDYHKVRAYSLRRMRSVEGRAA